MSTHSEYGGGFGDNPDSPYSPHNADDFDGKIAIVGAGVRVPGAQDVDGLWQLLRGGYDARTALSDEQLRSAGVDPAAAGRPDFVRSAYLLDDIDRFDASFFGLGPREADILDPQQRFMLECAWQALEAAGRTASDPEVRVGVFAGSFFSTYLLQLYSNPQLVSALGDLVVRQSNDKDYLATRIAYLLDLHGPAVNVQTSCSTSLVATHLGCQSLLSGECDVALVGGVSIDVRQAAGYTYAAGGILSPDGHCRAFDAGANGTAFGNGAVVLALKRLSDAVADGDRVHAVILGSAINNDGSDKVSFTAPSVRGQSEVIAEALAVADVDADSIGYVECHGTGTPLGDPIEIAALTDVYRQYTKETGYCRIGSAKTNFGHTGAASGALGLLKAALAVEHAQLPPSLHYDAPNPAIDFAASPFVVNDRLMPWKPGDRPRRAAVSSFGMGGTNAHLILEEAPPVRRQGRPRRWSVLLTGGHSARTAATAARRLADQLTDTDGTLTGGTATESTPTESTPADRTPADSTLANTAFTTQYGRRAPVHRLAVVADSPESAAAALRAGEAAEVRTGRARPIAFLFPGQGSQYVGMARELYAEEPVFRAQLDRCADEFARHLDTDLRELLFPAPESETTAQARLAETQYAQAALFAVEYALARQLTGWGVEPSVMAGHSLGEWVAACLAGVFDLSDAVELVSLRGRLLQSLPPGAMLAVNLPEDEAAVLDGVTVAAVNGPRACTVGGPVAAVDRLEALLRDKGVRVRRLDTGRAFHTPMVEPVLAEFAAAVRAKGPRPPHAVFLSNVTGAPIGAAEATDPEYWARHIRQPVRFHDMLRTLGPEALVVEVGPGRALSALAAVARPDAPAPVPVLGPRGGDAEQRLSQALAALWTAGANVDWAAYQSERGLVRVSLPPYPFERERHWIDAGDGAPLLPGAHPTATATPDEDSAEDGETAVLSVEAIRAEVTAAWTLLIGEPPRSPDEDFFAAGGDSLLAVQLVSRLRTTFDCDLPLEEVFDRRTVVDLTELLTAALLAPDTPDAADLTHLGDIEDDELAALLREIEGLSAEDLERELNSPAEDTGE